MDLPKNPEKYLDAIEHMLGSKPARILLYVGAGIILLHLSGFMFEAAASAITGFKKLEKAAKL